MATRPDGPAGPPLTSEEAEELWLRETAAGPDSLLDFVPLASPHLDRPQHLRALAELFARAEWQEVRACSSVPPRHGKTTSIEHFLVRYLLRHPDRTCGYATYGTGLAFSKSREMMQIATRVGLPLSPNFRRMAEWRTPRGGGVLAVGIGGPLTGYGIDGVLVIDDPVKNREEAESTLIRAKLIDWFTSTAMTRLEPGGSVIVNATRWHGDDLIGHLGETGKWEQINLPAVDGQGVPLWPERWSAAALDRRRREIGEYDWAALYLGSPRPRGGALFREPGRYDRPDLLNGQRILIACDPAATASTAADYSAIVVAAGAKIDGLLHLDILEVRRMQVEVPALARELRGLQLAWGCPVGVEAVGGFKAVPQMLRQIDRGLRVIELQPRGSKFTRAQTAVAAWNDGRIRVPLQAPWVAPFLREVLAFTGVGDEHDDQVDALAHVVQMFERLPGLSSSPPSGLPQDRAPRLAWG